MQKAAAIILATTTVIVATFWIVAWRTDWPAMEDPPRQGEALDPVAYAEGRVVHSADAESRLIREPLNTWTNLAFVAAGALLIARSVRSSSRLVGLALVAIGIGSFLYHASASRTLRHLDAGAMYALYFTMLVVALSVFSTRIRHVIERRAVLFAVGAAAFGIVVTITRNLVVFGVKPLGLTIVTVVTATAFSLALGTVVLRERNRRTTGLVVATLLTFAVAVACQTGDRPGGWLCSPGAFVQGHAIWHVLSALASYLGIRAIDSPEPTEAPVASSPTIS